jgi:hypothetical protein
MQVILTCVPLNGVLYNDIQMRAKFYLLMKLHFLNLLLTNIIRTLGKNARVKIALLSKCNIRTCDVTEDSCVRICDQVLSLLLPEAC